MKRTITILEDDLDGSGGSETVPFALDGVDYAIDLNEAHAKELREALSPFTRAARKAGGQTRTSRPGAATSRPGAATSRPGAATTREIRQWALSQGLPVNSRGRIQAGILEKYHAAKR